MSITTGGNLSPTVTEHATSYQKNGTDSGDDMPTLCNTKTSIARDAEYAPNIFGLDRKCGACARVWSLI